MCNTYFIINLYIIITEVLPHIGSATVKTRNNMSLTAARNILNALEGKPLIYPL